MSAESKQAVDETLNRDLRSPRPGLVIANTYCLKRRLGAGSHGSVWEAEHLRLGGRVALKFLARHHLHDSTLRARFEREARAICKVRSQHVVQILDHGVMDDLPFLVMELLEGEDLGQLLARERLLDVQTAAQLIDQVSRGLGRAHRAGFVHRDIKPENVFVVHEADGGHFVKLLDFGIVKQLESESVTLSQEDWVLGTPHYLSPEQILRPRQVDARADVWAVGVVAYRMLVGRLPFETSHDSEAALAELCQAIVEGRYLPPSEARPELCAGLDAWFQLTLATDPDQRFGTIEAAAQALQRIAESHATGTHRESDVPLSASVRTRAGWGSAEPRRRLQVVVVVALMGVALLVLARWGAGLRRDSRAPTVVAPSESAATPAEPVQLDAVTQGHARTEQAGDAAQPGASETAESAAGAAPLAAPTSTPSANDTDPPPERTTTRVRVRKRAELEAPDRDSAGNAKSQSSPAPVRLIPKDRGF